MQWLSRPETRDARNTTIRISALQIRPSRLDGALRWRDGVETNWMKLLEFLDVSGADVLFEQRELLFQRIPFELEKTLSRFIADGKPKEMLAFYQRMILETPTLKVAVGKTSKNRLMQLKMRRSRHRAGLSLCHQRRRHRSLRLREERRGNRCNRRSARNG